MAKKSPITADGPIAFTPYKEKRNEEYMNPAQLSHFRDILQKWRAALMKNDSAACPDVVDRASQEEEFNLSLRARDRERKLLKKIEESIERIENDDYGYCESCGVEIGIRRLEARPTATLCIDCKTIAEIKEKQMAA
jgi:DnaK suppressor protein